MTKPLNSRLSFFVKLFIFLLIVCQNTPLWGTPSTKEKALIQITLNSLQSWHIQPLKINDDYSEKAFKLYLKRLDPSKQFLTQQDINTLSTYKKQIDNQIINGKTELHEDAQKKLDTQIKFIQSFYKTHLETPFNFNKNETLEMDLDKRAYANNNSMLKNRWHKLLKYQVLVKIIDLHNDTISTKNSQVTAPQTISYTPKMEKEARLYVKKTMDRYFKRLLTRSKQDRFDFYLDALTQSYDPHTSYFPPADKEDFDISMTGKLEGIGAVLREEDGFIKVVRIIPGSASWRQKQLAADDIILKVTQKNKDKTTDLVGMPVRKAVTYIRGKKGTTVTLTVKKPSNEILDIPIVRDVVIIEETYAKAAIISNAKQKLTFGYIYLPSFYRDFKNRLSQNAADDVKNLLKKLQKQSVQGVILDLRGNGGGSLQDAVKISGHFIKMGPIVQVKNRSNKKDILYDFDPEVVYGGPLVVLINTYSASASEILSGALKDYKRAVIIGTQHSFGKGTVQTFADLDNYLTANYQNLKPMGSLKLSIQKFYRVNGSSTQYKGVIPDITLPSTTDYMKVGEKNLPHSLAWSEVKPLSYKKWGNPPRLDILKKRSNDRVNRNKQFNMVKTYVNVLKKEKETPQSLNIKSVYQNQQAIKKVAKSIEQNSRLTDTYRIQPVLLSEKTSSTNITESDWFKGLKKDIYLEEAVAVLKDMQHFYYK
ncbi:tail-specific protease [Candidatus Marinamargulisbacteria bacterium SCGC AG-439-L15]|nr:tail-specific protease [Candidatus Marinamargulisbacteria bacterium SCGC AG-439-L15]